MPTSIQKIAYEMSQDPFAGLVLASTNDGQRGVITQDDQRFIPFPQLGYNTELGLFDRRQFPKQPSEAEFHPWRVAPVEEGGVALLDGQGGGLYFAEAWQAAEAAVAMLGYLTNGATLPKISVADPALGEMVSASTAAEIVSKVAGYTVAPRTIPKACANGSIKGAVKDGSLWKMPRAAVLEYAAQSFRARKSKVGKDDSQV